MGAILCTLVQRLIVTILLTDSQRKMSGKRQPRACKAKNLKEDEDTVIENDVPKKSSARRKRAVETGDRENTATKKAKETRKGKPIVVEDNNNNDTQNPKTPEKEKPIRNKTKTVLEGKSDRGEKLKRVMKVEPEGIPETVPETIPKRQRKTKQETSTKAQEKKKHVDKYETKQETSTKAQEKKKHVDKYETKQETSTKAQEKKNNIDKSESRLDGKASPDSISVGVQVDVQKGVQANVQADGQVGVHVQVDDGQERGGSALPGDRSGEGAVTSNQSVPVSATPDDGNLDGTFTIDSSSTQVEPPSSSTGSSEHPEVSSGQLGNFLNTLDILLQAVADMSTDSRDLRKTLTEWMVSQSECRKQSSDAAGTRQEAPAPSLVAKQCHVEVQTRATERSDVQSQTDPQKDEIPEQLTNAQHERDLLWTQCQGQTKVIRDLQNDLYTIRNDIIKDKNTYKTTIATMLTNILEYPTSTDLYRRVASRHPPADTSLGEMCKFLSEVNDGRASFTVDSTDTDPGPLMEPKQEPRTPCITKGPIRI